MVSWLKLSEEEERKLSEELYRWEESVSKALEGDRELKRLVHEEIGDIVRHTNWLRGSIITFDDFAEMLSSIANKVKSYVRERHGIELESCYTQIASEPVWPKYIEQEIKKRIGKSRPMSSTRLFVKCVIPLPKKFEELELRGESPLALEIYAPLYFAYEKSEKEGWHVSWSAPPYDEEDIRVEVSPLT